MGLYEGIHPQPFRPERRKKQRALKTHTKENKTTIDLSSSKAE